MAEPSDLPLHAEQPLQNSSTKRARSEDEFDNQQSQSKTSDTGSVDEMPQQKKQRRTRGPKEKRLPDGGDDADIAEAGSPLESPIGSTLESPIDLDAAPARKGHSGWNQGVKGALRTSFAKVAAAPAPTKAAIVSFGREASTTVTDDARDDGDVSLTRSEQSEEPVSRETKDTQATEGSETKKKRKATGRLRKKSKEEPIMPPSPPAGQGLTVSHGGVVWALPPFWTAPPEDSKIVNGDLNTWDDRFAKWFERFIGLNPLPFTKMFEEKTLNDTGLGNLVKEAFTYWHKYSTWRNKNHLDSSLQAMGRAKRKDGKLTQMVQDYKDTYGLRHLEEGEFVSESEDDKHSDDGHADDEDLELYFPGITADENFCTSCASHGHRSDTCPGRKCRYHPDAKHTTARCPRLKRCSRCRQLGHTLEDCKERLMLAPEEKTECALCQAQDHLEDDCDRFWRSYYPREDNVIHKVKDIPIFCYTCGAQGHYGSECGINTRGIIVGDKSTWSKANWALYVDSNSADDPISGPVVDERQLTGRPNFGHGIAPQTHIYFEESDEDDDQKAFSNTSWQRQQPNSRIQISSNLTKYGHRGEVLDFDIDHHNLEEEFNPPPLPPGPPPPSHFTPGQGNLPARPPNGDGGSRPQRNSRSNTRREGGSNQEGQQGNQQNGHRPRRARGGRGGGRGGGAGDRGGGGGGGGGSARRRGGGRGGGRGGFSGFRGGNSN